MSEVVSYMDSGYTESMIDGWRISRKWYLVSGKLVSRRHMRVGRSGGGYDGLVRERTEMECEYRAKEDFYVHRQDAAKKDS